MSEENKTSLADKLRAHFGERIGNVVEHVGQVTVEVQPFHWLEIARELRDLPQFHFEQLIDLCGVDYLGYGEDEWATSEEATSRGFSRGAPNGLGQRLLDGAGRPRGNCLRQHLRALSRRVARRRR